MKTLEQRAMRLYPNHPLYQRQWIRIVRILGDKWLLAKTIEKVTK